MRFFVFSFQLLNLALKLSFGLNGFLRFILLKSDLDLHIS